MSAKQPPTRRLQRLARSVPIALVALASMVNLACSLATVQPRMAKDFASGETRVEKVALLPVDVSVQIKGEASRARAENLEDQLATRVQRGVAQALQRRGYKVTRPIDASGCVPQRHGEQRAFVIHPTDLAAMRVEIHNITSAHAGGPGLIEARVSSDLTRQIAATTGADASLYARGFVFVAPGESAGATVLKVLAATLMIVIVVGMVMMLFAGASKGKSKGKSRSRSRSHSAFPSISRSHHSSGGHRGHRHRGSSAGRAVLGLARAVAEVGEVALRTAPLALEAAAEARADREADADLPCHRCAPPPPPPPAPPSALPLAGPWEEVDEPGLPPTALPAPPAAPAPPPARSAPLPAPPPATLVLHDPGKVPTRSTVGLAVTLVQNSSGRVLWHAKQDFPVQVDRSYNVEKLVDHFFAKLPPAR